MIPRRKAAALVLSIAGVAVGMTLLVTAGARSLLGPSATAADAAAPARVAQAYAKLPVSFEANRGQSTPGVRFLARGAGYGLFLTDAGAVLSFGGKSSTAPLRMRAVGANPDPEVVGERRLPGRANYLIGRDPRSWLTGIPTYAAVRYRGVYPGIDQVFYGSQKRLEYDFVVAPTADPGRIALAFSGAKSLSLGRGGELLLAVAGGTLRQPRPFAYQKLGGKLRAVDVGYVLDGRRVGFSVGRYDHGQPLVIDPKIEYSTYLGGPGFDFATGIAVDGDGSAYVTGTSGNDLFVTKLDPSGSAIEYTTYVGGSGFDRGSDVAVDGRGRAYVSGETHSIDFPTTPGAAQPTAGDDDGFVTDAYVLKLSGDGTQLKYSTYLGGSGDERGLGIAVDTDERAYVTGETSSADFPVTQGAFQTSGPVPGSGEWSHAFVTKLSYEGTYLRYSTYLGGSESEHGDDIAVDEHGRAYVTGATSSSDFPTTPDAFQPAGTGGVFVTKLSSEGTDLKYSTYLGDNGWGMGIAVDREERAYVTGFTLSEHFPTTPGAFQAVDPDPGADDEVNNDAFVVKLSREGTHLKYATYLGGHGYEVGHAIALDDDGRAHVTGLTWSPDFPTTPDAPFHGPTSSCNPSDTSFVAKLNTDGSELRFSTYLPHGDISDVESDIAVDARGSFYVATGTVSAGCPTTPGAVQPASGGSFDAFVTKFQR